MSSAAYLLRFDDLCPTMNWAIWDRVEAALVEMEIRALLSVVPDNRDPVLEVNVARADFWDRVRAWQARGWAIGVHGYQHRYVTADRGLVGLHDRSEFAGLPAQEQEAKLSAALRIFERERIDPTAWVAPSHSFDQVTLEILKGFGIRVVSDGLSIYPHVDGDGMLWVPQQLWRLRRVPVGVWTVCCHVNGWDEEKASRFLEDLATYRDRISDFLTMVERFEGRSPTRLDHFEARLLRILIRGKVRARGSLNGLVGV